MVFDADPDADSKAPYDAHFATGGQSSLHGVVLRFNLTSIGRLSAYDDQSTHKVSSSASCTEGPQRYIELVASMHRLPNPDQTVDQILHN